MEMSTVHPPLASYEEEEEEEEVVDRSKEDKEDRSREDEWFHYKVASEGEEEGEEEGEGVEEEHMMLPSEVQAPAAPAAPAYWNSKHSPSSSHSLSASSKEHEHEHVHEHDEGAAEVYRHAYAKGEPDVSSASEDEDDSGENYAITLLTSTNPPAEEDEASSNSKRVERMKYFVFIWKIRPLLQDLYPSLHDLIISQALSTVWNTSLSIDEKNQFDAATILGRRYLESLAGQYFHPILLELEQQEAAARSQNLSLNKSSLSNGHETKRKRSPKQNKTSMFNRFRKMLTLMIKTRFAESSDASISSFLNSAWKSMTSPEKGYFQDDSMASAEAENIWQKYVADQYQYKKSQRDVNKPSKEATDDNEPRNNIFWQASSKRVFVRLENESSHTLKLYPLDCYHHGPVRWNDPLDLGQPGLGKMDEDQINLMNPHMPEVASFTRALLDFSDWDDYSRHDYYWPEFIAKYIRDYPRFVKWNEMVGKCRLFQFQDESAKSAHLISRDVTDFTNIPDNNINISVHDNKNQHEETVVEFEAKSHSQSPLSNSQVISQSKMFLFFLCLEHLGLRDYFVENESKFESQYKSFVLEVARLCKQWQDENNDDDIADVPKISQLLKQIEQIDDPLDYRVMEIIAAVICMVSSDELRLKRSSSKVGSNYQCIFENNLDSKTFSTSVDVVDIKVIDGTKVFDCRQKSQSTLDSRHSSFSVDVADNNNPEIDYFVYKAMHILGVKKNMIVDCIKHVNSSIMSSLESAHGMEKVRRLLQLHRKEGFTSFNCVVLKSDFVPITKLSDAIIPYNVLVTDGEQQWHVLSSHIMCKGFQEESVLELLHLHEYKTDAAYDALIRYSNQNLTHEDKCYEVCRNIYQHRFWCESDRKKMRRGVEQYNDKIYNIYDKQFKLPSTKTSLNASTSTEIVVYDPDTNLSISVKTNDGNDAEYNGPIKLKDCVLFYYLMYPNLENDAKLDEEEKDYRGRGRQLTPIKIVPRPKKMTAQDKVNPRQLSFDHDRANNGDNPPSGWPASLSRSPQNLYWIRNSNMPCICLGLKHTDDESDIRVLPISSSTYLSPFVTQPFALLPFGESLGSSSNASSSRDFDFTLALYDLANYELERNPRCKWYSYPAFVIELIRTPSQWSTWRMHAERNARGSNETRRSVYFSVLVNQLRDEQSQGKDSRHMECEYPWVVDRPGLPRGRGPLKKQESEDESSDDESAESTYHPKIKRIRRPTKSTKSSPMSKSSDEDESESESDTSELDFASMNKTNLFWLDKFNLPGIFYGEKGDELKDKFDVLPISCSTYHFPSSMPVSTLQPLDDENLAQCSNEKTRDFATALMRLAEVIRSTTRRVLKEGSAVPWPEFIYEIISNKEFGTQWRRAVERKCVGGKPDARKAAYFDALLQGYEEYLAIHPSPKVLSESSEENKSDEESAGDRQSNQPRSTRKASLADRMSAEKRPLKQRRMESSSDIARSPDEEEDDDEENGSEDDSQEEDGDGDDDGEVQSDGQSDDDSNSDSDSVDEYVSPPRSTGRISIPAITSNSQINYFSPSSFSWLSNNKVVSSTSPRIQQVINLADDDD